MKYNVEKKDGKLSISFTVATAEWQEFMQKAYEQNKSKYKVPGFRAGHVPRKMLENMYGTGLFFEDALYLSATEYYSQFLDKNKDVVPVSRPSIDEKSISTDDKGVKFAVVVVVKPDVTLGEYKGLTIKKSKVDKVTEEDINKELESIQKRNARTVEVSDRAVKDGDEVNLNYSGSVDGVKFDGGTAEKQNLTIGSHTFIEGFEEQLIGMNIGETKDIKVTFPKEYHAENLKGKDAVFTCTINSISYKELPKLDDEFAKDVSEFSTLKEYKDDIKKRLTESREKQAQNRDEGKLIETVVENAKMEIPQEMIDEQIDHYIQEFQYQLMYQGMKLDDYYKYTNSTEQQLRDNHKERAEKEVRTRLVFEEIVKQEKIKADKKSVDKMIKEYAEKMGQDVKTFQDGLTEEQVAYFENQVITDKLLDLLKENNTIA